MLQNLFQVEGWYWVALSAYFLGAIPFGLIITSVFLGFDVRKQGSGNIGMTNVMRTAGKTPGIITFLLDFGKGLAAVFLAGWLMRNSSYQLEWTVIAAAIAVVGHTRSIFIRFGGGKGVATNLGVWAAVDWRIFLIIALAWVGMFLLKKISSLSALVSLILLPVAAYTFHQFSPYFLSAVFLSVYVILLHHENVGRLLRGEEGKLKAPNK